MKPIKVTFQQGNDNDVWERIEPLMNAGHTGSSAVKTLIRELATMERVIGLAVSSAVSGTDPAPVAPGSSVNQSRFSTQAGTPDDLEDADDDFEIDLAALEAME